MRKCPVCEHSTYNDNDYGDPGIEVKRTEVFSMTYQIPDGWTLPSEITWYTCNQCQMSYGDGDFNQAMLDKYYMERYGYGVSNPDNAERLRLDAEQIASTRLRNTLIVDFGGAGDDGESIYINWLKKRGMENSYCIGPGTNMPDNCDVIYASHVLEHIYDLPETMQRITKALAPDGLLIVDVPDATGLLNRWKMPILDFNTKHLNHFTLRNLLDLGHYHGLESVMVKSYELEYAPCFQVHFKRLDVARTSAAHIHSHSALRHAKLANIREAVNIWGMSDIVWNTLATSDLEILDYIDNDPAYRGQTFKGKPILERPTNDAPIVIMAQGQRKRLIENIRKQGVKNEIIEI